MKSSLLSIFQLICFYIIFLNIIIRNSQISIDGREEGDDEFEKEKSRFSANSKFQDVINDIRAIKIELFGNPEENMDFFKRNKNVYDSKLLQRSMKIAKILELEELLQFYEETNLLRINSKDSFNKQKHSENSIKQKKFKRNLQDGQSEKIDYELRPLSNYIIKETNLNDNSPKYSHSSINTKIIINNSTKTLNENKIKSELKKEKVKISNRTQYD